MIRSSSRRELDAAEMIAKTVVVSSRVRRRCVVLALIDLDMPDVDGVAAARAFRRGGCTAPLVAVTATAPPRDAPSPEDDAIALSFDDLIVKPLSMGDADALVRRWVLPRLRPARGSRRRTSRQNADVQERARFTRRVVSEAPLTFVYRPGSIARNARETNRARPTPRRDRERRRPLSARAPPPRVVPRSAAGRGPYSRRRRRGDGR